MTTIHHLKITLKHLRPAIWREVQVPWDLRLDRLHRVIQAAMGREDCHQHEFSNGQRGIGELCFGVPDPEFDDGMEPRRRDERKASLSQLAPAKGSKFLNWYDVGDDWWHEVSVKAVAEPKPGVTLPCCVRAAGACPPEDCGGPGGYVALLEALQDPDHEEHESMCEWIGEDRDPNACDIDAVNQTPFAMGRRWTPTSKKQAALH